jgi:propanediol dehydratase large subunit
MTSTPETRLWLLGGVLVTAVQEGDASTVTLCCTVPGSVDTVLAALQAVATALQAATIERKKVTP